MKKNHNYSSQIVAWKRTHTPWGITPNPFLFIHSKVQDTSVKYDHCRFFFIEGENIYSGCTFTILEVVLISCRYRNHNKLGGRLWGKGLLDWKRLLLCLVNCLPASVSCIFLGIQREKLIFLHLQNSSGKEFPVSPILPHLSPWGCSEALWVPEPLLWWIFC